jgi:hypothetical protein
MMQKAQNTNIFINPSGFIEQHFRGTLSPEDIIAALKQLKAHAKKEKSAGNTVLILEDASNITKLDFLSPKMAHVRKEATKAAKEIDFERSAIYGPLPYQVIVTTLAIVSGKRNRIRVFDNRAAAIKWLLNE